MSKESFELLSALLDDELDEHETDAVLQHLRYDEAARQAWSRYHLQGALLRNAWTEQAVRQVQNDLASHIHRQVQAEPARIAPAAAQDLQGRKTAAAGRSGARPALAPAASLAAVAFLGLQYLPRNTPQAEIPRIARPGQDVPASSDPRALTATRWQSVRPEHAVDLNEMLVEHGEFSSLSGVHGLAAYAKFVSYDAQSP